MGRAEDVARKTRDEKTKTQRAKEAAKQAGKPDVPVLARDALRLLEQADFAGAEIGVISRPKRTFFGRRYVQEERAFWPLGVHKTWVRAEPFNRPVVLWSDGTVDYGPHSESMRALYDSFEDAAAAGLQAIIEQHSR